MIFFFFIKTLPKHNFIFLGHLNPKESWNHMLGKQVSVMQCKVRGPKLIDFAQWWIYPEEGPLPTGLPRLVTEVPPSSY